MLDLYPLIKPLIWRLDPERAHGLALRSLSAGLIPPPPPRNLPRLQTSVFGLSFDNPVGLAAGFDKNGKIPDRMLAQGFGFVEIGSVTPNAQPGNPAPRMFRLDQDHAIINRLGFNNEGVDTVRDRLRRRPFAQQGILGVNLGANRGSRDATADYVSGLVGLYGEADYFVVNVSSPNTPDLRDLQARAALDNLISRLYNSRSRLAVGGKPTPILVKISPDLDFAEKQDIASVVLSRKVDGLIVSNTTVGERAGLKSQFAGEEGGLSGKPLFALSTTLLREMYQLTEGRIPLIGVGGVSSGEDAYEKIRNGASLVQLYTAYIFEGPQVVDRIKVELDRLLERDGFSSVLDAVGADVS